jgi:hypothetical protein
MFTIWSLQMDPELVQSAEQRRTGAGGKDSVQISPLLHRPLAKLEAMMMANKPQDMCCTLCGHKWIGSGSCPNCHGVAKSEGEMTKKTLQGEEPTLKKGLR